MENKMKGNGLVITLDKILRSIEILFNAEEQHEIIPSTWIGVSVIILDPPLLNSFATLLLSTELNFRFFHLKLILYFIISISIL